MEVQTAPSSTGESGAPAGSPPGTPSAKKHKVRGAWLSFVSRILAQFIGAAASIAFGVALVQQYHLPPRQTVPPPPAHETSSPRRVASTLAGDRKALLVLPVEDFSSEGPSDRLADALTDTLTAAVAQLEGVRVLSRTSAMTCKAGGRTVPAIARDLAVDLVVETSIFRVADRLRVTSQLIDGRSDEHLWAATYELPAADVFAVQAQAAALIARGVGTVQVGDPRRAPAGSPVARDGVAPSVASR